MSTSLWLAAGALAGAGICWAVLAAPELPAIGGRLQVWLRRALRLESLRIDLLQAELGWMPVQTWLTMRWAVAVAAGLAGLVLFQLAAIGLVMALAAYHLVGVGLEARRRRIEARRQRALLEALRFGSSVMSRSGSAIQMLQALAKSGPIEAQPMFGDLVAEAESSEGTLVDAVQRVRDRLADPLFDDLAMALILHWKRGGKLVPALDALVAEWQETLRLQRDAKTLRAGVETSVLLLAILPFFFLLMLHLLAPNLLAPLDQPAGEVFFALAVGWMVLGYRILQRMSEPPREERISLNEVAL